MPEENAPREKSRIAEFRKNALPEMWKGAVEAIVMAVVANKIGPLAYAYNYDAIMNQLMILGSGVGTRVLTDTVITGFNEEEDLNIPKYFLKSLLPALITSYFINHPDNIVSIEQVLNTLIAEGSHAINNLKHATSQSEVPVKITTDAPTKILTTQTSIPPTLTSTSIPPTATSIPPTATFVPPISTPSPEDTRRFATEAKQTQETVMKGALLLGAALGITVPPALIYRIYGEKISSTIKTTKEKVTSSVLDISRGFFSKLKAFETPPAETITVEKLLIRIVASAMQKIDQEQTQVAPGERVSQILEVTRLLQTLLKLNKNAGNAVLEFGTLVQNDGDLLTFSTKVEQMIIDAEEQGLKLKRKIREEEAELEKVIGKVQDEMDKESQEKKEYSSNQTLLERQVNEAEKLGKLLSERKVTRTKTKLSQRSPSGE